MPVPSHVSPAALVIPVSVIPVSRGRDAGFDARWSERAVRGVMHDQWRQQRLRLIGPTIPIATALLYLFLSH
jgi:hypothetical protein